jgi:hypothetical protein
MCRWPRTTAVILAILTAMSAAQLHVDEGLTPFATAIGVVGQLAAALALKTMLLMMINPTLRRKPFEGSYLVASFLVMIPVFVFYASASYTLPLGRSTSAIFGEPTPVQNLVLGFPIAYVIFSACLGAFLHIAEAMQLTVLRGHNKND